jgi:rhamnosyltransferase subunit B
LINRRRRPAITQPVHFVLVTIGSAGDLFPFLRMAIALQGAGHHVTFLGPTPHEPWVSEAGLRFVGLPVDTAVLDDPDLWHPHRGFGVVWRATRPAMAELPRFVQALAPGERCVLLVHPLALPEADLCRAARPGIKIAAAWLAPSNLPTVHDPLTIGPLRIPRWVPHRARRWLWQRLGAALLDPVALPDLNAARAAYGLPPVESLLGHIVSVADLSVMLFPEWFAHHQPDWPAPRYQAGFPLYDPSPGASLPAGLADFLAAGERPLVFTPGTGNRQAVHFFQCALDATLRLRRRAIFLTAHREQLPASLPPGVLWHDYAPLRALLPRVDALVHHGGIGTTAEALCAGVPQLVVPFAHDQFDNAARVEALGAGLRLPAARLTGLRLTRQLHALLASKGVLAACGQTRTLSGKSGGYDGLPAALAGLLD